MLWPKINSYKEFDNEKKFLRLKNSPPFPHNFSNGLTLRHSVDPKTQLLFLNFKLVACDEHMNKHPCQGLKSFAVTFAAAKVLPLLCLSDKIFLTYHSQNVLLVCYVRVTRKRKCQQKPKWGCEILEGRVRNMQPILFENGVIITNKFLQG